MTDNQMMFNQPETRSKPPLASKLTSKRQPVVLDMGEGSREQGFRQNGCR